jgi:hypothetical protein
MENVESICRRVVDAKRFFAGIADKRRQFRDGKNRDERGVVGLV